MNKIFEFVPKGTFSEEFSYDNFYAMASDLAHDRLKGEDKEAAEAVIYDEALKLFELEKGFQNDIHAKRLLNKAINRNGRAYMEILTDVLEDLIYDGFYDNPFFMNLVEQNNVADGNRVEYWYDDTPNQRLIVAEVARDHHDITLQRVGGGKPVTSSPKYYGLAVGTNIRQYLLGKVDFAMFIRKIYEAWEEMIVKKIHETLESVGDKMVAGSDFNLSLQLTTATADQLADMVADVDMLSGGNGAVIVGTRKGLNKLEKVLDIDWVSSDMKNEKYHNGRLAFWGGYPLVELKQYLHYNKNTGKVTERLINDDQLYVFPQGLDKFIKFVNYGQAHTRTVNTDGAYQDDIMSFEYVAGFDILVILSQVFGVVKLTQ